MEAGDPDRDPLTARLVLGHAGNLLRMGFARVVVAALVFFLEPAIVSVLLEGVGISMPAASGILAGTAATLVLAAALFLRLLTPVFFAGYLDEAIGREYFDGHHRAWREISREIPWGRLLIADVALIVAIEIGLALLVIPGIVICLCFALVGPVVVQERRGVLDAFRRTYRISRLAIPLVLFLVVLPLMAEGLLAEALHQVLHQATLLIQLLGEWMLLVVLGITVGLLEVALATELMRRNPEPLPLE
jgi:hypothetical protein